jgi:hypothetical protein
MAAMPSPPLHRRQHLEDRRRKGATAAAVADNDDPAGNNGEWNARAAGAGTMASSRAMDTAARSEAFFGVSARLLQLMVMVCSTIPCFPSNLLRADRLRADASRCFVPTLSVCTDHVRPCFCTQFVDTPWWQCHRLPCTIVNVWKTDGGKGPPPPQSLTMMTPPATTASGTREPQARGRWRAAGRWMPRQGVRLLW